MSDLKSKVTTIDLNFHGRPKSIAAFLLDAPAGPILFETGPHSTIASLEAGIRAAGFEPEEIKHVFITHIHLDHAGAAWTFADRGAQIYLHPLGARHMIDPSRFVASAKQIYGELMDALWGELRPISESCLTVVDDGEAITIGDTKVTSHHTPGHAKHHIAWQVENVAFVGDVAGISIEGGPVVPPCPPPDIVVQLWVESIKKLDKIKEIDSYYLGHFGKIDEVRPHMQELISSLHAHANFIEPFYRAGKKPEDVMSQFQTFSREYLLARGITKKTAEIYEVANPAYMGVYGLMRYWRKFEEGKNINDNREKR